ncbi:MAG: erythromycin esterase family protein [Bacteroidales bacterium]|nr:erythromycin esterase family protein [Bacteroidales bacterium]
MSKIYICLLLFLTVFSCTKNPEELNLDPETKALVDILQDELLPLTTDPLNWEDQDLRWLDPLAEKSVVALGESTHGTAEFFNAKHRIFRYLVESHGFKVFAFEADFGESVFIDEAVQQGSAAEIDALMRSKMHFWTWKTEEVKDLLEWMCNYNLGKPEEEKVHYMGVDCQFNTYHPEMAMDYLRSTGIPFQAYADSILQVARTASEQSFESYSSESFDTYLRKLEALQDSMTVYKDDMIGASSEQEYQLQARIVEVIMQVSEVRFYSQTQQSSINYRDKYMAENTAWLLDYFEDEKIVVWAHNFHISNMEYGVTGSMGNYLTYQLGDQYSTIGFLFSHGTLTAVGMEGENYTELGTQTLDTIPKENSLNAIMSYTGEPAFSIELETLRNYLGWFNAFNRGMEYFQMGAVYNNRPEDYYSTFDPDLFHFIIYFDKSTASKLL